MTRLGVPTTSTNQFRSRTAEEFGQFIRENTRIEDHGHITPCWIWYGRLDAKKEYGHICVRYREERLHRFMWRVFHGVIPKGLWVLHHCDQMRCWRPEHLFVGTPRDNTDDRDQKGRQAKGEIDGNAVLTVTQVLEIRARYPHESQQSIADSFGIAQTNVSAIIRRLTWNHV